MRHNIKLKKLNRTTSHRKAMFANLVSSLIKHEQIQTTLAKAKSVRPIVEKLITKGKDNSLSTIRYLLSAIKDKDAVKKLVEVVGPQNKNRSGGYVRIIKSGFRTGDAAPMAFVELVEKSKNHTAKKPNESAKETKSATEGKNQKATKDSLKSKKAS